MKSEKFGFKVVLDKMFMVKVIEDSGNDDGIYYCDDDHLDELIEKVLLDYEMKLVEPPEISEDCITLWCRDIEDDSIQLYLKFSKQTTIRGIK
ncbi:MAG: hypothetical protein WC755_09315 [Candidatus Woesearchaeota archaeon]|jgi:hypothetical protein